MNNCSFDLFEYTVRSSDVVFTLNIDILLLLKRALLRRQSGSGGNGILQTINVNQGITGIYLLLIFMTGTYTGNDNIIVNVNTIGNIESPLINIADVFRINTSSGSTPPTVNYLGGGNFLAKDGYFYNPDWILELPGKQQILLQQLI